MMSSLEVKKPVEAIQCVNTFSLLQRKMYNVLLANAASNLRPEVTHQILMRDLCQYMGYRSHDYKTIKQKFRELRRMDIEWDIVNEHGNTVWTHTSPLSLARIVERSGICEYEFTPSLVPFLDRPAQYAKFSLAVQSRFKSSYGLALYENCERYRNLGYTKTFDVNTFRKLMGVADDEYVDFFALKRRVINKAVAEVNEHADFTVSVDYQKVGRRVSYIQFTIVSNKVQSLEAQIDPAQQDDVCKLLQTQFGMSATKIQHLLNRYELTHIKEKADVILQSNSFKQGQIKNMAAYLNSALQDNYQQDVSSQQVLHKQRETEERQQQLKAEYDGIIQDAKHDYHYFIYKQLPVWVKQLSLDDYGDLMSGFEAYLQTTTYHDLYLKYGLEDILVAEQMFIFMRKHYVALLNQLTSFQDYMQTHCAKQQEALVQLKARIEQEH